LQSHPSNSEVRASGFNLIAVILHEFVWIEALLLKNFKLFVDVLNLILFSVQFGFEHLFRSPIILVDPIALVVILVLI